MKDTWQVILAGEGGQGLIVAGILLAEAASVFENLNATQTQSYGIASRGGFSQSEVVISAHEIIYPGVEDPDIVLALTQEAYDLYAPKLSEAAILVYDAGLIRPDPMPKARSFGFPFTETARDLGRVGVTNLVALGAIQALSGLIKLESLERAVTHRFGQKAAELNLKALGRGVELVGTDSV